MDVPLLLAAVSADSPCGEDLEYDADFLQLERDAQGKPERSMGDAVQQAEPPNWRLIEQSSTTLLQRSKDLRVTHFLLQSALALDGFAGLANVLTLINDLLGQYWATLHPQLDAQDDNDPTVRINALAGLTSDNTLSLLRDAVLARSRTFGQVNLRGAVQAAGFQAGAQAPLSVEELSAALRDTDPALLAQTRDALDTALNACEAIEQRVNEQVGSASGVDFTPLSQLLRQGRQVLLDYANLDAPGPDRARVATQAADAPGADVPGADAPGANAPAAARPAARAGEINSRQDVRASLDKLLQYYARHEPSSPLPVLLRRAQNLVDADFATIVRDLIPDGLSQFENLRGPEPD